MSDLKSVQLGIKKTLILKKGEKMKFFTHTISRLLYAIPFLVFGVNHIVNAQAVKEQVPSWIPGDKILWVYFTGVCLIAASLALLFKKYGPLAGKLLALMIIIFLVTIHAPEIPSPEAISNLLKDMALVGAALAFSGMLEDEGGKE